MEINWHSLLVVQNAHAYVNAAFSVVSDGDGMVQDATFVFGGISYHTVC